MPFDGSGNYAYPAGTPGVSGQPISSTTYNAWLTDMNASMSKMLCRDGQAAALADIPMGGFKFTGLAAGSAAGHSVRFEQIFATAGAQLLAPSGTSSLPGMAFSADPDNGFYFNAANNWRAIAGATEVLTFTSAGLIMPLSASLNGGGALVGTFTGSPTLSGVWGFTGTGQTLTNSQNVGTTHTVTNANGGTSALAGYSASNGTATVNLFMPGTAYSGVGISIAGRGTLYAAGAGGIAVQAQAGPILFAANGTAETARLDTGKFGLGITPVGTLHVHQAATPTMYLTDNVLGSTYGGVIRGYGLGGNGGYLELGVLDGGTFLKGIQISQQTNSVSIWTGTGGTNANQFSIGTGGAITITAGQLIFPATQNPAAGANTLDDYEEGTFTPTITFGGSAVGVTYGIQAGFYTKIGNRVIFSFYVVLTSKGSSTGAVALNGLPFTSANVSNQYSCTSQYCGTVTNNGIIQCYVAPNTTQILMEQMTPATGVSATITNTNVANTSNFMFTSSYQTA